MAVALHSSTFSKSHPTIERRSLRPSVRLVVAAVVLGLVAIAAASGAWIGPAIVTALFLAGTAVLASGDDPLSVRQAGSIGAVHLVAALLLAL